MLVFGDEAITPYITSSQENNVQHRVFTGKEANELYPDQLTLPHDYTCMIDEDAGILRAGPAVLALQV